MSRFILEKGNTNIPTSAYIELENCFRRIAILNEVIGLLHWDMSVMMPSGGAAARTEQLTVLKISVHEMLNDPKVGDLLSEAGETLPDEPWKAANLREMRRVWIHANAVERELVEALSRACSACELQWREARLHSNFKSVLPYLSEVLNLTRQSGVSKAEVLGCSPYEALLDEYEPGAKTELLDKYFADLSSFLPSFLQTVLAKQGKQKPGVLPPGPFPIEEQRALGVKLMEVLGFNFDHGRLDSSLHPFCGGVPDDIRVTTRYTDEDFTQSLMGVLHETGHALYESGLPPDWGYQPVGAARGMALHESQSLLIEMQACRSREFLSFAAPLMREAFSGSGLEWDVENLHRLYTKVEPGFIRVDADEVTYQAHVILRYRLERGLIKDDISLVDLPTAWNEGMSELLGICPPNDSLGCLQDIHWYDGAWGYFPTYTMGALAAAQFFSSATKDLPNISEAISEGKFSPLIDWMRRNVHSHASLFGTEELIKAATGRPLDTADFKEHLLIRYG